MAANDSKLNRYHFSVSPADNQLNTWVNAQHNLSASIRMVLKNYISRYGMLDATTLPAQFDDESVAKFHNISVTQTDYQAEPQIEDVQTEIVEPMVEEVIPETSTPTKTAQESTTNTSNTAAAMLADMLS